MNDLFRYHPFFRIFQTVGDQNYYFFEHEGFNARLRVFDSKNGYFGLLILSYEPGKVYHGELKYDVMKKEWNFYGDYSHFPIWLFDLLEKVKTNIDERDRIRRLYFL